MTKNKTDNKKGNDKDNSHREHRARMRKKLMEAPSSLADHEIVEMLLYGVFVQGNTNPQAHSLYDAAGKNLKNILTLDNLSICSIDGLGESTATFIRLLEEFYNRIEKSKLSAVNPKKLTRKNIEQKLHEMFFGLKEEKMIMITVDKDCCPIHSHTIATGSSNAAVIPVKKVVRQAISDNASYVFLAHNHPNGILSPSPADIETTKLICNALSLVEIPVIEHYIVTQSSILGIIGDRKKPQLNNLT